MQAQYIRTSVQLGAVDKPLYFSLMRSDFYEDLYDYPGGDKDEAQNNLELYVHVFERNAHKHTFTFQYFVIAFKLCRIWGW